jgi:N-sulfoglucosamine sulfohydrolase
MRPFVLAALLSLFVFVASAQPASRPNILFFIGDNWSYGHAGCLGDAAAQTPNFDRIARDGMLFRHAFCPVPSCSPTRSCLLTGRAAHQLEDAASLWSRWPSQFRTFPDLLRESGYETGFMGKGWAPGNHKDFGRAENPAGPEFKTLDTFMTSRNKSKPFFFWIGNVDTALHKWRDKAENPAGLDLAKVKVPPELPDTNDTRASIAAYHDGIRLMDLAMGEALRRLEVDGLLDSTLIIYTSDNGWQFPRGLANCYDTGTRVPFAVRWPGHVPAGRVAEEFITLTDLAPTSLELAAIKPASEMSARSFLDVMLGQPSKTRRDGVFLERERHANVRAGDLSYPIRGIRTKDHLLLLNLRSDRWPAGDPIMHMSVGDFGDVDESPAKQVILQRKDEPQMKHFYDLNFGKRPSVELYDLREDPAQLTNVAGQPSHSKLQAELTQRVRDWMQQTNDPRLDESYDSWDKMPYFGGRAKGKAKK